MEIAAAVQRLGQAAEQWRNVFAALQHQVAHGGPRAGSAGGLPYAPTASRRARSSAGRQRSISADQTMTLTGKPSDSKVLAVLVQSGTWTELY